MTVFWIIIVAAFALLVLGWEPWMRRRSQTSFTGDAWASQADDRWRMIDDLIVSRVLDGMSRQKVIETLGSPERSSQRSFLYRATSPFDNRDAVRVCFDSTDRVFKVRPDHDGC